MNSPSPFRRYLLRIVAPAIVVTVVGLAMLVRQYKNDQIQLAAICRARALNAADELRDAIREAGTTDAVRQAVLAAWPQGQSETTTIRPVGALVWVPRKGQGLVWSRGEHAALWARLNTRIHWADWTSPAT